LAILGCIHSGSVLSKLFSMSWLQFLGKISFSLYVLHFAIIRIVLEYREFLSYDLAFVIAGAVLIATVSFHLIEQPFIRLGRWLERWMPASRSPVITSEAK